MASKDTQHERSSERKSVGTRTHVLAHACALEFNDVTEHVIEHVTEHVIEHVTEHMIVHVAFHASDGAVRYLAASS